MNSGTFSDYGWINSQQGYPDDGDVVWIMTVCGDVDVARFKRYNSWFLPFVSWKCVSDGKAYWNDEVVRWKLMEDGDL